MPWRTSHCWSTRQTRRHSGERFSRRSAESVRRQPVRWLRAREALRGDLVLTCARAGEIDAVRAGEVRQRLEAFGRELGAIREEMTTGRSLGLSCSPHEISWWNNAWHHLDVSSQCGAPPAVAGSAVAGYQRVNGEPRACYLDAAGHLHELRYMGG